MVKPFSYVYLLVKCVFRALFWWPQNFAPFRRVIFDTAPPGSIVYAGHGAYKYLVSAGDKTISRGMYVRGEYDLHKLGLALKLLDGGKEIHTLVDVGANIGCICIPAMKMGSFNRAIAIEPDPQNFALLEANIRLNGLSSNISAHNVALSDREGSLEFELSKDNFGDHRIRTENSNENDRSIISVRATTFDKLISDEDLRHTLVWIDTQGHEGFVLSGAGHALEAHVPIVFEFWPQGLALTDSYAKLKQSILKAGYSHYYELVGSPKKLPFTEGAIDELFSKLKDIQGSYTDILVIRE